MWEKKYLRTIREIEYSERWTKWASFRNCRREMQTFQTGGHIDTLLSIRGPVGKKWGQFIETSWYVLTMLLAHNRKQIHTGLLLDHFLEQSHWFVTFINCSLKIKYKAQAVTILSVHRTKQRSTAQGFPEKVVVVQRSSPIVSCECSTLHFTS
jgi:hypothetical protein